MLKLYNENTYDDWYYESRKVLKSGQTAVIRFSDNDSYYDFKKKRNVWLLYTTYSIGKEKQIDKWLKDKDSGIYKEKTGKSGLDGIFWALEQIKELIKLFEEERSEDKFVLEVGWDDNKRRDMYYRGLSPLGFKFNNLHGYKALYYINKN